MGVEANGVEVGQSCDGIKQLGGVLGRYAKPTHASVDFYVRVDGALEFFCNARKAAGLIHGRQRGHYVILHRALYLIRQTRAEHYDGPTATHSANVAGLIKIRHAKNIRARLHQQRGDLAQPVPVRVGLHHSHYAAGRANAMPQPRKVAPQRVQINLRPTSMPKTHALALGPWRTDFKRRSFTGFLGYEHRCSGWVGVIPSTVNICAQFSWRRGGALVNSMGRR